MSLYPSGSRLLVACFLLRPRHCATIQGQRHRHRDRRAGGGRARRHRHGTQHRHQCRGRSSDQRSRHLHLQQLTPGRTGSRRRFPGFKTFVREGITLRTAETVTVNLALVDRARSRKPSPSARQTTNIESNETHDLADDREQAHLGAAAQRPAGLHAAAADRRHALHADDVRRDRLLRHARVGRQRLALDPRQPHRQQRVPHRRRAERRAPAAAPATGTTRRRWTRSRSSRSARRASTPRSAAPAAASST